MILAIFAGGISFRVPRHKRLRKLLRGLPSSISALSKTDGPYALCHLRSLFFPASGFRSGEGPFACCALPLSTFPVGRRRREKSRVYRTPEYTYGASAPEYTLYFGRCEEFPFEGAVFRGRHAFWSLRLLLNHRKSSSESSLRVKNGAFATFLFCQGLWLPHRWQKNGKGSGNMALLHPSALRT